MSYISDQFQTHKLKLKSPTFQPQKVSTSHLMVAIHLGRSAVFQQTMTKSTKTRLSKCDEKKMSMMHYAAMNDYHNLICMYFVKGEMQKTGVCDCRLI